MSETTPVVTTTTSTEGTPAAPVAPTVTESAKPTTTAAWREQLNAKARGNATPSLVPEALATPPPTEQPRGPDGKFVPKPAGAEPAASAAPAIASDGGATPTAAAVEAAAERVRIALEEGHPLRERGLVELPFDVPKEHEETARWLASQPVKKREISEAHEQARTAHRQALEAQAEAAFWRENAGSILTPEFYAKYADIKQTYGEADAERYKAAIMAEAQGKLSEKRAEVTREMAARETVQTAQQFRALAYQDATARYPGWTPGEVDQALQAYGAWIHATKATAPSAQDWYRIADVLYSGSPAGQARRAEEARRIEASAASRATTEAQERERQALEQAAQGRARNPLGAVPNVQTGLAVPGAKTGPANAREFLQQTRDRARGLV